MGEPPSLTRGVGLRGAKDHKAEATQNELVPPRDRYPGEIVTRRTREKQWRYHALPRQPP